MKRTHQTTKEDDHTEWSPRALQSMTEAILNDNRQALHEVRDKQYRDDNITAQAYDDLMDIFEMVNR